MLQACARLEAGAVSIDDSASGSDLAIRAADIPVLDRDRSSVPDGPRRVRSDDTRVQTRVAAIADDCAVAPTDTARATLHHTTFA